MSLVDTCTVCQQDFTFPALQKEQQNGICPACNKKAHIKDLQKQILVDQAQMDDLYSEVCKLHRRKRRLESAYYDALSAWEKQAKVHAALDRRIALNKHELHQLQTPPKQTSKSGRKPIDPAARAKKALEALPADVRAAIIASLKGDQDNE